MCAPSPRTSPHLQPSGRMAPWRRGVVGIGWGGLGFWAGGPGALTLAQKVASGMGSPTPYPLEGQKLS